MRSRRIFFNTKYAAKWRDSTVPLQRVSDGEFRGGLYCQSTTGCWTNNRWVVDEASYLADEFGCISLAGFRKHAMMCPNLVAVSLVLKASAWWRHQMEIVSALLAICAGHSPVRPLTRSFDVFFDLLLNKRLSKQWWGWWSRTLWRHCNGLVKSHAALA